MRISARIPSALQPFLPFYSYPARIPPSRVTVRKRQAKVSLVDSTPVTSHLRCAVLCELRDDARARPTAARRTTRPVDQSKAQRTARPMVPDRSRSSKHVQIPPLSAAFPLRSACTKKQLVARGGSPHARNGHPIDSEASAVAQEAAFFATRKLSFHRRRLRRCSAPTVGPKPGAKEAWTVA